MSSTRNGETYPQIAKDFVTKIYDLKEILAKDLISSDAKWTTFVTAARSYRYPTLLKPFPPHYLVNSDPSACNIEALLSVIDQVQSFDIISKIIDDGNLDVLDTEVVELLHWVLVDQHYPKFRTASTNEIEELLSKIPHQDVKKKPTHVFLLDLDPNFEKIFQNQKNETFKNKFAFHGSKLDSFHSILKHGLHQHVCKNGIFGEGIYLSSELSVSMNFSKRSAAWGHSQCGSYISCIGICEYVENPDCVKFFKEEDKKINIPEKYILITNNDVVRIRALLFYGEYNKTAANLALTWINRHKYVLSVIFYTLFLSLIGISSSGNGYYFFNLIKKKSFQILKYLQQMINAEL